MRSCGLDQDFAQQEVGVDAVGGEVVAAGRAVAAVLEVGGDALVAEGVAAGGHERIMNGVHTDWALQAQGGTGRACGEANPDPWRACSGEMHETEKSQPRNNLTLSTTVTSCHDQERQRHQL